jgi:hypothetical protein
MLAVAIGVAVLTLFAVVATAGPVRYVEQAPDFATDVEPPPPAEVETEPAEVEPEAAEPDAVELPAWISTAIRVVVIACCVIAAIVVVRLAWRNRPRLRWRRRPHIPDFETVPDVADAVTADAERQQAALRRGTPRNAIVECWMRLERAVDDAGFRRRPADTSTELVERVLAESLVDDGALTELAALYREARFSDHQLGEQRRDAAIAALDAVHDGLRRAVDDRRRSSPGSGSVADPATVRS